MNPNANLNLPPPVAEAPQLPPAEAVPLPPSPEQLRAPSPEAGSRPTMPAMPLGAQPQDDTTQLQAVQQQSGSQDVPAAASVDDAVLDKTWIEKAKQIVEQTAADPYEQNRQLAAVKADYLQTRYGKQIKLAD